MSERFSRSGLIGELSAEFAGTMILILFGCGVVAQVVAGGALTTPPGSLGNHRQHLLGVGHRRHHGCLRRGTAERRASTNPAVTLALAAFKGFPWSKVAPYALAQTAGAFSGGPPRAVELHRGTGEGRPRAHPQDAVRVLHAPRQRQHEPAGLRVGRVSRPGHGHRHPAAVDPGHHGPARHRPAPGAPVPVHHRPGRRGHRHGLGHQRGLRDQPGT